MTKSRQSEILVQTHAVVCSALCPSVKKEGEEWTHVDLCQNLSLLIALEQDND